MSKYKLRRTPLTCGTRKAIDVLSVLDTVMVMILSGEAGGEREMTEAISPQK